MTPDLLEVDPFELPEWLGETDVTWAATCGLRGGARVTGVLTSAGPESLACDLLAIDQAFPAPVLADHLRTRAHQAWQHGQVLLLAEPGGTPLVLAAPGRAFTADLALDVLGRLALAVGASAERYAAHLRIGR